MGGFRNRQSLAYLRLSGGTLTGALTLGGTLDCASNSVTNGGNITAANANGYMLENAAASTTNPTIIPDRNASTSGLGSSGSMIASGTRLTSMSASDFGIVNNPTNGMSYATNNGGFVYPIKLATASLATTGGAGTQDSASLIPAGSIVIGVIARVTTVITGCTTFSVGTAADATAWGTTIAVAANTTTTGANFAATWQPTAYPAATDVRLTAAGGGAVFTTGAVRLLVAYMKFDQLTS